MAGVRPKLSFIVPCKGRLKHLQATLPLLSAQPGAEVLVVDYDCPEGTKEWVSAHYPAVRVVHAQNRPQLNLSHARNLGGQHASGEWLSFLDADALPKGELLPLIETMLRPGTFGLFSADWPGLPVCRAEDFRSIHGYDETFQGWGCADNDLLLRLAALGRECVMLPASTIEIMPHEDHLRMAHYALDDKWLSLRINGMYLQIKTDIARALGVVELSREELQSIYAEVQRVASRNPSSPMEMRITLPQHAHFRQPPGWSLGREWIFRFAPVSANA